MSKNVKQVVYAGIAAFALYYLYQMVASRRAG